MVKMFEIKFLSDVLCFLGSQLNCFAKGNVTLGLRERFHLNMTDEQLEFVVEKMIESSLNSLTTRVYDTFQYYTNGISK
jgi:phosphatidylinositol 4-kinase